MMNYMLLAKRLRVSSVLPAVCIFMGKNLFKNLHDLYFGVWILTHRLGHSVAVTDATMCFRSAWLLIVSFIHIAFSVAS